MYAADKACVLTNHGPTELSERGIGLLCKPSAVQIVLSEAREAAQESSMGQSIPVAP